MKKAVCVCLVVVFLMPWCFAEGDLYDALGVAEMISASPARGDVDFEENPSLNDGIRYVFEKLADGIKAYLYRGVRCVAIICAVSFLISSAEPLLGGESDAAKTTLALVGASAVTLAASGSITSVMGVGKEFISGIEIFSKALLPSVAAAEAACGLPGAATVRAGITLVFSDVLISIINHILLPLVYINIFVATANVAAKNAVLKKISDLSVKTISVTLKVMLGAFVSYMGVAGLVAEGADKTGLSAAKFAISTAVPVVGGVVSEAAETVVAGALMIKNAIGVFAMLTILSAFTTPFAVMLVNYLSFKAASLICAPAINGSVAELSSKIAESFGLVIAMCAATATVIIIAVIASMKSVGVL